MQQRSVLLISSDDLGWTDLRTTLHVMENVHVVGEATSISQALQFATLHKPEIIITAATVEGEPIFHLLSDLRYMLSPTCTIVVFAACFQLDELRILGNVPIEGYLQWNDLSSATLPHCLAMILTGKFVVSSREIAEAFDKVKRGEFHAGKEAVQLTRREQAVLKHLAAGLTRGQIAEAEHISLRTVKRTICSLEEKLEAPCQFVLGFKAAQIGIVV